MRVGWHLLGLVVLALGSGAAWAQPAGGGLVAGLSFVAQAADGLWRLYRVDERGAVQPVATQTEPRQACVTAPGTTPARAVYVGADAALRLVTLDGSERVLARTDARRSYTQPCLSADGSEVVVVEMADGKSIDTEILRFSDSRREGEPVAPQAGAQHDPYLWNRRLLVYAHVGCSVGCQQLLVEIWLRDLVSGQARQLSLLNALSQNPVTDGRRVVFSSNATGGFQLWEVGVDGSGQRQLTRDLAQATSPALCGGALYFVSAGPSFTSIARLADDGTAVPIPVPGLKGFRSLRCVS